MSTSTFASAKWRRPARIPRGEGGLREAGLLEWAYIYGGDECPSENRSGVMQMFEAVKSRWPELRTKTSLQWAPDDPSLPVDTWAQTYMDYYCEGGDWDWRRWKGSGKCERTCTCNSTEASRAKREAWQAAGKKYDVVALLLPRSCHAYETPFTSMCCQMLGWGQVLVVLGVPADRALAESIVC